MSDKPQLVYSGDLTPQRAWQELRDNPRASLVDVRTDAEWQYVGLPDLSELNKEPIKLSWKVFPSMTINESFVAALAERVGDKSSVLVFLCRSGVRSAEAAAAMTSAGYQHCYNILEGFEGDSDEAKHRGTKGGWKVHLLPWTQG